MADSITNEQLAGKVVEAVTAVQDAEQTVVEEGKKLAAHMADPNAHGLDVSACIAQGITDHEGNPEAHGLEAFKSGLTGAVDTKLGEFRTELTITLDALDEPTLVRTGDSRLSDARTPVEHRHEASEINGIPDGAVGAEQLSTAITDHDNNPNAHGGSGQALITAHEANAKAHGIGTAGSPLMKSIQSAVEAFSDNVVAGGEGCMTIKGQVEAQKDLAAQYANAPAGTEVEPGKFSVQTGVVKAAQYANGEPGVVVEDGKYSAKHWADVAYQYGNAPAGTEVEPGKKGVQTYVAKADQFANAKPGTLVEPGKYSGRHWAEEARARADSASAVSGLPNFGILDKGKAIVVNNDCSGWILSDSVGGLQVLLAADGFQPSEDGFRIPATINGGSVFVDGLGIFSFDENSIDPVDGETCLLPEGGDGIQPGRWLLASMDTMQLMATMFRIIDDLDMRRDDLEHEAHTGDNALSARLESLYTDFNGRLEELSGGVGRLVTRGKATLKFSNVPASGGVGKLTASVDGAKVGDGVLIVPPATLVDGFICHGQVTDEDTVTVRLTNCKAAAMTPVEAEYGIFVFSA